MKQQGENLKDFDKNGFHYTYIADNVYQTYDENTKMTIILKFAAEPNNNMEIFVEHLLNACDTSL